MAIDLNLLLLRYLAPGAWAAAAALGTVYLARAAVQIRYVTLADGRRLERRLPVLFRVLLPLTPRLGGWLARPGWQAWRTEQDQRIVAAGYEGLLRAEDIAGLRMLLAFLGIVIGAALRSPLLAAVGAVAGAFYPVRWLQKELVRRHRSIQRALPFVLDLLTISVEAGVDFMTGLRNILDRRAIDPLGEELLRVFHEVRLGKTRRDALRETGRRVRQPDLATIANALAQADELGVSLGAILRIQADQLRVKRFLRAERLAQEAPVKMLAPLVGLIFPAVFIILLGPVLLQRFRFGF